MFEVLSEFLGYCVLLLIFREGSIVNVPQCFGNGCILVVMDWFR